MSSQNEQNLEILNQTIRPKEENLWKIFESQKEKIKKLAEIKTQKLFSIIKKNKQKIKNLKDDLQQSLSDNKNLRLKIIEDSLHHIKILNENQNLKEKLSEMNEVKIKNINQIQEIEKIVDEKNQEILNLKFHINKISDSFHDTTEKKNELIVSYEYIILESSREYTKKIEDLNTSIDETRKLLENSYNENQNLKNNLHDMDQVQKQNINQIQELEKIINEKNQEIFNLNLHKNEISRNFNNNLEKNDQIIENYEKIILESSRKYNRKIEKLNKLIKGTKDLLIKRISEKNNLKQQLANKEQTLKKKNDKIRNIKKILNRNHQDINFLRSNQENSKKNFHDIIEKKDEIIMSYEDAFFRRSKKLFDNIKNEKIKKLTKENAKLSNIIIKKDSELKIKEYEMKKLRSKYQKSLKILNLKHEKVSEIKSKIDTEYPLKIKTGNKFFIYSNIIIDKVEESFNDLLPNYILTQTREKKFKISIEARRALKNLNTLKNEKFYIGSLPTRLEVVWVFRLFLQFTGISLPDDNFLAWVEISKFIKSIKNGKIHKKSIDKVLIDYIDLFSFSYENICKIEMMVEGKCMDPFRYSKICEVSSLIMFSLREAEIFAGLIKGKVYLFRKYSKFCIRNHY